MNEQNKIFILNYLEKSKQALKEVEANISTDSFQSAQNRIYYAIFYSVVALGYANEFITSKHSSLMGWFNKKFVHEDKIFDKNMFIIYQTAFTNRMDSDYSDTMQLDKESLLLNSEEANYFVAQIIEFLKNKQIVK